jgi:hypothetical protein
MLTRRIALLSSLAAGACATSGESEPADSQFRNLATPSESVHSGVASEDGELRLTVRLCRYPELGRAWVWVHARTPDGFFSYVDHLAPCGRNGTPTYGAVASYADQARTLVFERRGVVDKPTGASVRGKVRARKSTTSKFGAGDHEVEIAIAFAPARLYSGLNAGRTEVFGRSKASVTVDGKRFDIEGPAQFHEQRQSTPRFTQPFCYMTLWGSDAATTMLIAPNRRDGYLLEGVKPTEVEAVSIDPPAARRALRVKLADGRSLEGEAGVVQAYTIPLVGNTWRGHMVKVELGGRKFMGHVNDYIIGNGVLYSG